MSCKTLFEYADSLQERVWFWTFTFIDVHNDWEYPVFWNGFRRELQWKFPFMCGLRVVEPHPGGHGLHYHALIVGRWPWSVVAGLGRRYGMGRVGFDKDPADPVAGPIYLGKYLSKKCDRMFSTDGKRSLRRWAAFGPWAKSATRVSEIVVESNYMRARREIVGNERLLIGYEQLLLRAFRLHGKEAMRMCYTRLLRGETGSACQLVSPNIRLTAAGGLEYIGSPILPYRVVKNPRVLK